MGARVTMVQLALEATIFLPQDSIPIEARGHKQRGMLRKLLADGSMEPYHIAINRRPSGQGSRSEEP